MNAKRVKNPVYLAFVRTKPCLVCNLPMAEAHHLKFAQPRGFGIKTGDNFAVPVCHKHHMELHHFGDEKAWWAIQGIDALGYATELWEGWNGNENA